MSKLQSYKGDVTIPVYGTIADAQIYLKADADKVIAELKAKLESVQASAYAESVDAGMENRRLKRALWLMGARLGKMGSLAYHNIKAKLYFLDDDEGVKWALKKQKQWEEVERKFRAKEEQYK